MFAGRDASRGLGTFALEPAKDDTHDDLSDLTIDQMNTMKDWEAQFLGTVEFSYDLSIAVMVP